MLSEHSEASSSTRQSGSVCMTPSVAGGGGRDLAASAMPRSANNPERPRSALWLAVRRLREGVWAPVLFKTALAGMGMALLAALGVASTWATPAGVPVVERARALNALVEPADGGAAAHPQSVLENDRSRLAAARTSGDAGAPHDKIVLNLASAEELTRLPGVGPKRARAIVDLRARLHGFKRAADLLRIRGIGPRSLKRMLPYLVLDEPSGSKDAGSD